MYLLKGRFGTPVAEGVNDCRLMNIAIACAFDQLLLYSGVFARTKKHLRHHLPGHGRQLNAPYWGKCSSNALL